MLFFPMVLNILLDHLRRDLISYCPHKKTILPQLSTPKLFFDLRILSKYLRRGDALQNPNHLRNRISRRKVQEQMDMIRGHLHLFNLKRKLLSNSPEQYLHSFSDIASLNPFTILRSPYQMVSCVIYGMTRTLNRHAKILTYSGTASRSKTFHPRPKGGVFKFFLQ